MTRFDFAPYRRSMVGFDRLFDMLENQGRSSSGDNYPPFNIEKRGDDAYRITLAVAGFTPEDLDITAQQNLLVIQGRKGEDAQDGNFLHVGIAQRGFERRFELADYVRVESANLENGLLVALWVVWVVIALLLMAFWLPGKGRQPAVVRRSRR